MLLSICPAGPVRHQSGRSIQCHGNLATAPRRTSFKCVRGPGLVGGQLVSPGIVPRWEVNKEGEKCVLQGLDWVPTQQNLTRLTGPGTPPRMVEQKNPNRGKISRNRGPGIIFITYINCKYYLDFFLVRPVNPQGGPVCWLLFFLAFWGVISHAFGADALITCVLKGELFITYAAHNILQCLEK